MGKLQQSLSFVATCLIVLVPIISIFAPRALSFLPAVVLVLLLPLSFSNKEKIVEVIKTYQTSFLILVASLGYLWFSTFWAVYPEAAIERVIKLSALLPLGACFLMSLCVNSKKIYDLSLPLLISCSLAAIFIIIEIKLGCPFYKLLKGLDEVDNFSTAVYNRGAVAIILIATILFVLRKSQGKEWLLFLPIFSMLFFVQSQSAQILFIVALAFYYIFPFSRAWAWKLLFGFVALGMLIKPFLVSKIYMALPQNIHEYPFFKQSYFGYRFEIWDYVSRKALEMPFIGHGLEFTKKFKDFDTKARFWPETEVLHPHSFIVQTWIEQGLLGIIIAISLIGLLFRFLYLNLEGARQKSALMILVMSLIFSTFSQGMWQSWWLGLVFILAGLHVVNIGKKAI